MKEIKSWIRKISKNTTIIYIPLALAIDDSFPFKLNDKDKDEIKIKIDGDRLIIEKVKEVSANANSN